MVIVNKRNSRESIKEQLINAAKEIIIRADDIIGDIDGCVEIDTVIHIEAASITTIYVNRELISGCKLSKEPLGDK